MCYSILKRLHGIVLGQFNQQVVRAAVTCSKPDFVREMSRVGGVVRCTEGYIRREAQGLHMGHVVYTGGTGQGYEPVMMGYSGGSCISSGSTIGLPPLLRKVTTCARLKLISIHNKIHTLLLVRSYSRYTNDTICSSSEPRFSPFWPAVEQKSTTRCEPDMPWVIMVCDGPLGCLFTETFQWFSKLGPPLHPLTPHTSDNPVFPSFSFWWRVSLQWVCVSSPCCCEGSVTVCSVFLGIPPPCALTEEEGLPPPPVPLLLCQCTHTQPAYWPDYLAASNWQGVRGLYTHTGSLYTHLYIRGIHPPPPPPGLSTLNEMSPQIRLVYDVAGHGIRPLSLQNVQVCRVPMPTLIATFTSRSPELGKTENCRAVTAVLTVRRRYLLIQKLTDFR